MIGVALKGLLGRKLRATLTGFAIVLGVAMVSGSLVLTDTIEKSFDAIYSESYENSDVVISSKDATSTDGETAPTPRPSRPTSSARSSSSRTSRPPPERSRTRRGSPTRTAT